ncbi:MAG: deoxyhypusine synthase [Candidatus Aminicenantes bacterium]|nr:MAG: deoxyhypusine synthase [Candidatus Aminicenantes bacterium]
MKKKILKQPTIPIEVKPEKNIDKLIEEMSLTAFQGRKLAEVVEVWGRMLQEKEIVIWLGLAGAMIPAGMRKILGYLIRKRMLDVIVTTGANMYHDLFEAMGGKHYIGSHFSNDIDLKKLRIDRMYDVFADENKFYKLDMWIEENFCSQLKDDYQYSSREILQILGQILYEETKHSESVLSAAYYHKVPIFSPAICDSAIGFSIMFANRRKKRNIILNSLKDIDESSLVTEKAKKSGVVYVGGGIPKNFIQQTAVIAKYQTGHDKGHDYAVQMTTDMPMWGGLSGSTLEEGQSWGKIDKKAHKATCYVDATIALPLVAHALSDRFKEIQRKGPIFKWKKGLHLNSKRNKKGSSCAP